MVQHIDVIPEATDIHNLSPLAGYHVEVKEKIREKNVVGQLKFAFDSHKLLEGQKISDVQAYWFEDDKEEWVPLTTLHTEGNILTSSWSPKQKGIFMVGAPTIVWEEDENDRKRASPTPSANQNGGGGGSPGDTDATTHSLKFSPETVLSPNEQISQLESVDTGNSGTASFKLPLKLPHGRRGIQPELEVQYNSDAHSSWLGRGWTITGLPTITLDSTFGAVRYDGSEKYTYQGALLADQGAASGGGTLFKKRQENDFERIVRKGNDPSGYTWEIDDQFGTKSYFGSRSSGGLNRQCSLSASNGNNGGWNVLWGLCEKRDLYGNFMTVDWAVSSAAISIPTSDLLPANIYYTGFGNQQGVYRVEFVRGSTHSDVHVDCRRRWCVASRDLLTEIKVYYQTSLIRRYSFEYGLPGQFGVTLLRSISEYGALGGSLYTHHLEYYDDIAGSCGTALCNHIGYDVPDDHLVAGINVGPLDPPDYLATSSAISSSISVSVGYNLYVGVGFAPNKQGSIGFAHGDTFTETAGLTDLVDLNGDRLPDKVYMKNFEVWYRPNLGASARGFGDDVHIQSLNVLSFYAETSWLDTNGVEGYAGVSGFAKIAFGFSFTTHYWEDVNGDGFTDLVVTGVVYYNRLVNGVPTFATSSEGTAFPLGVGGASPDTGDVLQSVQDQLKEAFVNNSMVDVVTRWVAPFTGTISLTVPFTVIAMTAAPTKSLRVSVQLNSNDEIYSHNFDDVNQADTFPASITVTANDAVYIRVGTKDKYGGGGSVLCTPVIQYTNYDANAKDSNGLNYAKYSLEQDMTLFGNAFAPTISSPNGTASVFHSFLKNKTTTDDVTLAIFHNGEIVAQTTMLGSQTGQFVLPNSFFVATNDSIGITLFTDSPIDLRAIQVLADPLLVFAPSQTRKGNITLSYSIDQYPVSTSPTPIDPFVAPSSNTTRFLPRIDYSGSAFDVVITIKSNGALLLKRSMRSDEMEEITFDPITDESYFIEASTRHSFAEESMDVRFAEISFLDANGTTESTVRIPLYSQAPNNLLNSPFRGWSYFGYNSTKEGFTVKLNLTSLNADADSGATGQGAFAAFPSINPFGWTTAGASSIISPKMMNNTHLGSKYTDLGSMTKRDGLRGFPKVGTTVYGSVGGGVPFASASISGGVTLGTINAIDMNGDQFPDIATLGGFVQFTRPDGTLEGISNMGFFAMETSLNHAENLGIGGSPAGFMGNGEGNTLPGGKTTAKGGTSRSSVPQFGINFGYDRCDTYQQTTFIDINGDGLTDSCQLPVLSSGLDCRISTGYGYIGTMHYDVNHINRATQEGAFIGPSLGFSDGYGGYGGGLSFSYSKSYPTNTLMDMNGDGKPDAVSMDDNRIMVAINMGTFFASSIKWGEVTKNLLPAPVPFQTESAVVREDLSASAGGFVTIPILVWILPPIFVIINPEIFGSVHLGKTTSDLRDVNGDGCADLLYSTTDNQLLVAESRVRRTNLLKTINGHLGSTHTIDYQRVGNTPQDPNHHWVVSSVTVNDGISQNGPPQTTRYTYGPGQYDFRERVFRGFSSVTKNRISASGSVYSTEESHYKTDSFYSMGFLEYTVTKNGAGAIFTEQILSLNLAPSGTLSYHPQTVLEETLYYEGALTPGMRSKTQLEYDSYGHVIVKYVNADDSFDTDNYIETTLFSLRYSDCLNKHVIGIPVATRKVSFTSGNILAHVDHVVDCDYGAFLSISQYVDENSYMYSNYTYYENGNLATTLFSPNEKGQRFYTLTQYDTSAGIFPIYETDSHGYVAQATYDFRFGLPLTKTDFNGRTTTFTYDEFARVKTMKLPDSTYTAASYTYQTTDKPMYCLTQLLDTTNIGNSDMYFQTVIFVDGFGRTIQAKTEAFIYNHSIDGGQQKLITSGWVVFDEFGRKAADYVSIVEPMADMNSLSTTYSNVPPTYTYYDVMNRVVRTVQPDSTAVTTTYGFGLDKSGRASFLESKIDENGYRTDNFKNIWAVVTSTKTYLDQDYIWTRVVVDELSRVVQTLDDDGNSRNVTYDMLSRPVVTIDPNKGISVLEYDGAGNLVSKTTSNTQSVGGKIRYEYDYSHLVGVSYPLAPQNNVNYTWGNTSMSDRNRVGRVYKTEVANKYFREELAYDNLGRVSAINRSVSIDFGTSNDQKSATYNMTFTYDSWGRMLTRSYGDGEVLYYNYNIGGNLESAYGKKGTTGTPVYYINFLGYNEYNRISIRKWANNVNETLFYDTQMVERVNRRMLQTPYITKDRIPSQILENVFFTYDNAGTIKEMRNGIPNYGAPIASTGGNFTYKIFRDPMYRIVGAEGIYYASAKEYQTFAINFTYNHLSSITSKNQKVVINTIGSNGQVTSAVSPLLTYNVTFTYDSGRPNLASEVMKKNPGSYEKFCFVYDDNGNTITIISHTMANTSNPTAQDQWQSLCDDYFLNRTNSTYLLKQMAWDDLDRLQSIDNQEDQIKKYAYNDKTYRIAKNSGDGVNLYLDRTFQVRAGKNSKYYFAGGIVVAGKDDGRDANEVCRMVPPTYSANCQYFYHTTSTATNWVANMVGKPIASVSYLTDGEPWVTKTLDSTPAPASTNNLPVRPDGNELDETGYLYNTNNEYFNSALHMRL